MMILYHISSSFCVLFTGYRNEVFVDVHWNLLESSGTQLFMNGSSYASKKNTVKNRSSNQFQSFFPTLSTFIFFTAGLYVSIKGMLGVILKLQ